jgi:hypothetical protein
MNRIHVTHDNNSSKGVGFTGLLQLAFIILKLCGVIKWSWWAVLIPTWVSLGIIAIVLMIMFFLWNKS